MLLLIPLSPTNKPHSLSIVGRTSGPVQPKRKSFCLVRDDLGSASAGRPWLSSKDTVASLIRETLTLGHSVF